MKKINPKVIGAVIALLGILVAGGVTANEVIGEERTAGIAGADPKDTGI